MGGSEQPLTGPDFKNGVSVQSLKSGEKLLGHADGAPVLLIREGDHFYAIGAKCTHYGANLDDGLLTDGSIRCPWHHACFNIKTGEANKAPALNPLPTWKTEVRDGKVFVGAKCDEVGPQPKGSAKDRFVIVGSGAAGHAAAERLRNLGFIGQITVISEDTDVPYDRPNLSKDYLAGTAPEEWMSLRGDDFYKDKKIQLRLKSKVTKLDPTKKQLTLSSGDAVEYDKCLIATGGVPVKPPIPGIELSHVHFLRSFADCRSLIADISGKKKIVVVGAGFIGLEAAAALKTRGLDVTVIAPNEFPLEHAVGREVGAFLKSVHEQNGIHFALQRSVEKIERTGVILNDKSIRPADVVLVAVGIRPSADWTSGTGIQADNGIPVNSYLETSVKDVFAAGDVARWPSPFSENPIRIEHWAVAQRQGQRAAENMLGLKREYKDVPFFWSQQFDVVINHIGYAEPGSAAKVHGSLLERNCAVVYSKNGKTGAILTMGRDLQNLKLEKAFESGDQKRIDQILNEA